MNNFNNDCTGNFTNKISDHKIIFLCRNIIIEKNKERNIQNKTNDNTNIEDFINSLTKKYI